VSHASPPGLFSAASVLSSKTRSPPPLPPPSLDFSPRSFLRGDRIDYSFRSPFFPSDFLWSENPLFPPPSSPRTLGETVRSYDPSPDFFLAHSGVALHLSSPLVSKKRPSMPTYAVPRGPSDFFALGKARASSKGLPAFYARRKQPVPPQQVKLESIPISCPAPPRSVSLLDRLTKVFTHFLLRGPRLFNSSIPLLVYLPYSLSR